MNINKVEIKYTIEYLHTGSLYAAQLILFLPTESKREGSALIPLLVGEQEECLGEKLVPSWGKYFGDGWRGISIVIESTSGWEDLRTRVEHKLDLCMYQLRMLVKRNRKKGHLSEPDNYTEDANILI